MGLFKSLTMLFIAEKNHYNINADFEMKIFERIATGWSIEHFSSNHALRKI